MKPTTIPEFTPSMLADAKAEQFIMRMHLYSRKYWPQSMNAYSISVASWTTALRWVGMIGDDEIHKAMEWVEGVTQPPAEEYKTHFRNGRYLR